MRILIISDLHGNAEALSVLPQDYDQLWVLGDLVNYGPNPREIIEFVQGHATLVVRGNHDHAIGFDVDPRCSGPYRAMAAEMGRFTQSLLAEEDKNYLRTLPLSLATEIHDSRFQLCHATPTDPLFAYCPPESTEWKKEVQSVPSGFLLVGHTHLQFQREMDGHIIVNPGSLGQPKSDIRIREERLKRCRFHLAGEVELRMHNRRDDTDFARAAIEPARRQEGHRTDEQRETQGELDREYQHPQKRSQEPADHP